MNEPSSDYAQSWEGNEGNEQNCSNTTGLGDSLFQNQFRYCLHTSKSSLAEHKKSVKFIQALKPNLKKWKYRWKCSQNIGPSMFHVPSLKNRLRRQTHVRIHVGPQVKWTVKWFKLNQNQKGPSKFTVVLPCRFWTNSAKLFWVLFHLYGRN